MILSVSRRTDIPAFYSDWFFERIKEGFVCVRNPMNAHQVSRVSLSPDVVDCIVFWTKNARPMLARLDELDKYKYYFQFTINDYGKEVEPNVPPLEERLDTFIKLSEKIGKERVIWRYDPIVFTSEYTPARHLQSFAKIAERLRGSTEKVVFSLVDVYISKNNSNLLKIGYRKPSPEELDDFLQKLANIAKQNGLVIASCAEQISDEKFGIKHNSCIDDALIERIIGAKLNVKPDGQREYCQCVKCDDIGSYDTCPHGCVYCYANYRPKVVAEKLALYDPKSPLLCERLDEALDRVNYRPVKSLKAKASKKSNPNGDGGSGDGSEQITLF